MNRDQLRAMAGADLSTVPRAELERLARLGLEVLADVDAADLTPAYAYPGPSSLGRCVRNRYGESTKPGVRWATPRELVELAARRAAEILVRRQPAGLDP